MSLTEPTTLKERVEEFWNWYATVADRYYQTIEDRHGGVEE